MRSNLSLHRFPLKLKNSRTVDGVLGTCIQQKNMHLTLRKHLHQVGRYEAGPAIDSRTTILWEPATSNRPRQAPTALRLSDGCGVSRAVH